MPFFSTTDYEAAGGLSRLYESEAGGRVRFEAQLDSISVLWSTDLPVRDIFERLVDWLPPTVDALLRSVPDDGSNDIDLTGLTVREAVSTLSSEEREWSFVRFDFSDRVLTWESAYEARDQPSTGSDELGLLAAGIDEPYVSALIQATSTRAITENAENLLAGAYDLTRRYQPVHLGPSTEAGA